MTDIVIQNDLDEALVAYDSRQTTDEHSNYYGTLTKLSDLSANSSTSIPETHASTSVIIFDSNQKPLTRLQAAFSNTNFTVSDKDVQAMTQADAFVTFVAQNPDSSQAKKIAGLTAAKDIDAFFAGQPDYTLVTTGTYMLAVTYRAANPAPAGTKPEDVTYSLSKLITYMTGMSYPSDMADVAISDFFFRDEGGLLQFGGTVTMANMPFEPTVAGIILGLFAESGPVAVKVAFDTNIGPNIFGTKIVVSHKEIDIPLGGNDILRIASPTVSVTINPAFKFVIFEVEADFPLTVFGQPVDTKLSLVVDNVEVEVGLDIDGQGSTLATPPLVRGLHLDNFGLGLGLMFEPPGYALGIQGEFHIGDDANTVVALDDNQFAIILDLEGDVPNPVYLSFYVPKLTLATLFTVFTNVTVDIDIPITFEDLSFHWSENPLEPLALPDGTMSKGGYGFSGYMDLFGLKSFVDVEVALTQITADAVMGPVVFGKIFSLTGQGKALSMKFDANGNPIRNNTIPRTAAERAAIAAATTKEIVPAGGPELHVSTVTAPYVKADADAALFGHTFASVDITVDNSGLSFDLTMPLAKVSCLIETAGSMSASFAYGPDFKVPLPDPLGTIHLQATIDFSFSATLTSTDLVLSASGGFGFMGLSRTFGPLTLDIDIAGLEQLVDACCNYIVTDAKAIFGDIFKDALTWATNVAGEVVSEVDSIASGLKEYFGTELNEAGSILQTIGIAPDDAAADLQQAYIDATAETLATALTPFGLTSALAGTILQSLGYSTDDIAKALASVFHLDAPGLAKLLGDLGVPTQDVATLIEDIFTLSPNTISDVLKTAGFPVQVIADAFHAIGGPFSEVGDALESALATVEQTLDPSNW